MSQIISTLPPENYWIFYSILALIVITLAIVIRDEPGQLGSERHGQIVHILRAGGFLLGHTAIVIVFILCMYGVDALIKSLGHELFLFGQVPVSYMFDTMDVGVASVFGYRGLVGANQAFKE